MALALAELHSPWLAVREIRSSLRRAVAEGRPNIEILVHPVYADELRIIRGEMPATFDGYPIREVDRNDPSVVHWKYPDGTSGCWAILPFW